MKPLLALSFLLLAFASTIAGCGSSNDAGATAATPATPPSAETSSAAHMSPEAQAAKAAAGGH